MNKHLKSILSQVASGTMNPDEAYGDLKNFEDIGYAKIDYNREQRQGFPEVVFGEGKTADQILSIFKKLIQKSEVVLGTRIDQEKAAIITGALTDVRYYDEAKILLYSKTNLDPKYEGEIGILCAGTSDLPIAEEAALTAMAMGNKVKRFYDIGVAGIHRLFHHLEDIKSCRVLIVIAGMEGALPSVVGGLTNQPIIAVPTDIGYGAHFNGLAPLLAMLNSCSSGITVVNINNGFGAAYSASLINRIGG